VPVPTGCRVQRNGQCTERHKLLVLGSPVGCFTCLASRVPQTEEFPLGLRIAAKGSVSAGSSGFDLPQ
jgi:hypothetical protein